MAQISLYVCIDFYFVNRNNDYFIFITDKMVRVYRKKMTQRSNYSQQSLKNALEGVKSGASLRSAASKLNGTPTRTLARHREGAIKSPGYIKLG